MKKTLNIVLLALLLTSSFGGRTHAAEAFFEALYDVPVMPGLEEVKEQAMLFDKPGGRIASVVAGSKVLKAEQILRFYAESLPQLGWRKMAENQYVRGEDRLVLELVKRPPLVVVHFTLSPLHP